MSEPLLVLEGLEVQREDPLSGEKRVTARDVCLRLAQGEQLALVGENGAGKTSLLLALVGATEWSGRVALRNVELGSTTLESIRERVGFVFATPADQLFCDTVEDELAFGLRARGRSEAEIVSRVDATLTRFSLAPLRGKFPGALSLGEQRRVALGAALITDPDLLLLDEPTASLDGRARRGLIDLLRELPAACVVATHDLDFALELGMRVVALREGRVVADGPAEELLRDAVTLERAGLEPPFGLR